MTFRARIFVLLLLIGVPTGFASAQEGSLSGVTVADDGRVAVVGSVGGSVFFNGDLSQPVSGSFVLGFSPGSSVYWTHPSRTSFRHQPQQIGTDGSGVYVGEYDNSNDCLQYGWCQEPRGSVVRIDAQGALDWTANIGVAAPGPGSFHAVTVGPRPGGGACFAAKRTGPAGYGGGSEVVLGLIGPGGGFVWTHELHANFGAAARVITAATGDGCLFGGSLACSGGGCPGPPSTTLVFPGGHTLPVPDEHTFLARVSDAGVTSWARTLTGPEGRRLSVRDLGFQNDRFYVGGEVYFEWRTYVAALALDGDVLWMREPTGSPPFPSVGFVSGLSVDPRGGVYVAGSRSIVSLDSAGVEQARVTFVGSLSVLDLETSADRVYVVGMGTGPITVGDTPAELSPFWGGFLATLTADLDLVGVSAMERGPVPNEDGPRTESGVHVRLHPNPVGGPLTLVITLDRPQRAYAEVFDVIGRSHGVVFEGSLTAGESRLRVTDVSLPPGVYICRVVGESGTAFARFTMVD